jgi:hypothetical protein
MYFPDACTANFDRDSQSPFLLVWIGAARSCRLSDAVEVSPNTLPRASTIAGLWSPSKPKQEGDERANYEREANADAYRIMILEPFPVGQHHSQ